MVGLMVFKLIIWGCISYGITQIITESTLFSPLRGLLSTYSLTKWLGELISCVLCTSVWISAGLSIFVVSPSMMAWPQLSEPVYCNILFMDAMFDYTILRGAFLDAMLGSTIVWFMHCIEGKLIR